MSIRLSCPSCNTSFTRDAISTNHRATCPRCGDEFPVRGLSGEETGDRRQEAGDRSQETGVRRQEAAAHQPAKRGLSARRAGLVVVVLGLLGLVVGLAVHYTREPKPEPPAPPPEATLGRLVGLGYLPAECNVVFAIQPGPLLEYAARTKQDPRELLTRAGVPDQVFGGLDSIGLSLPQIDHIAGGVYLPDSGELRMALVLVLKQPLANEEEFRKKLNAKSGAGKQKYDTVELAKFPLLMARVSPTVWVFGFSEGDFAAVEKGGFGPGGTQLRGSDSEGLRKMLASVPPEAAVWVAADDDRDWTQKPLAKLVTQKDKKWLPAASNWRGGLFAISFGEKPRMRLLMRMSETATAEQLRAYFQARAAEIESATAGGDGTVARFDGPFDLKTLQRFIADLK